MVILKQVLPRRIIRLRELRHITQRGLAELSGVSVSALNQIESGLAPDVKLTTLLRLANSLDAAPDTLLAPEPSVRCNSCSRIAESILDAYERSHSAEALIPQFGLTYRSIEQVLDDEYAIRRRRRTHWQ